MFEPIMFILGLLFIVLLHWCLYSMKEEINFIKEHLGIEIEKKIVIKKKEAQ